MKQLFIALAIALTATGCNVQTVDMAQPILVADNFYGSLKAGDTTEAMTPYAPSFKASVTSWPKFLTDLQKTYGPVTAAELLEASLSTNNDSPCYKLTYAVRRGVHATEEGLFLCSENRASPWAIHGHSLIRSDNGSEVTAGLMPQEISTPTP